MAPGECARNAVVSSRTRGKWSATWILLFILGSAHIGLALQPKDIHIAIQSKWQSTSLLHEAGEFMADERPEFFWSFVTQWGARGNAVSSAGNGSLPGHAYGTITDAACYQHIVETANAILNRSTAKVFTMTLALRNYSPKIVTYAEMAAASLARHQLEGPGSPTPCCWVDLGGSAVTDDKALREGIAAARAQGTPPQVYIFDHEYKAEGAEPPGSAAGGRVGEAHKPMPVVAVLYGALGSPCFARFHAELSAAVQEGHVRYIFRPVFFSGSESRCTPAAATAGGDAQSSSPAAHGIEACVATGTREENMILSGYGVELAIKNMEYKAVDDSKVKEEDKGDAAKGLPRAEDVADEVNGFVFSKLVERRPGKAQELMTFRDHLLSSAAADTDEPLKVWDLKDLGLQAAQRILGSTEPLRLMQDISHNFPSLASSLSAMPVNSSLRNEVTTNHNYILPGKNLLLVNGGMLDIDNLDSYELLKLVRSELSVSDNLLQLKLPPASVRKLLKLPLTGQESPSIRIDLRSSEHLLWINDIEKDHAYSGFSPDLRDFLVPVFPGQMRYVRANVFNAIIVMDPGSPEGLIALDTIEQIVKNSLPFRMAILPVAPALVAAIKDQRRQGLLSTAPRAPSEGDTAKGDKEKAGASVALSPAMEAVVRDQENMSTMLVRWFHFLQARVGRMSGYRFLVEVADAAKSFGMMGDVHFEAITPPLLEKALAKTLDGGKYAKLWKGKSAVLLDEFKTETSGVASMLGAHEFVEDRGVAWAAYSPALFLNGAVYRDAELGLMLGIGMQEQTPWVQEQVYYGKLRTGMDVHDHALTSQKSYKRYNERILLSKGATPVFVNLAAALAQPTGALASIKYLHHPGTEDEVKPMTFLVACDLSTAPGLQALRGAVARLAEPGGKKVRLGFIQNPASLDDTSVLSLAMAAVSTMPSRRQKLVPFLQKLLHSDVVAASASASSADPAARAQVARRVLDMAAEAGLNVAAFQEWLPEDGSVTAAASTRLQQERQLAGDLLKLPPGKMAVMANGRVVELPDMETFSRDDFELLEAVELEHRASQVMPVVEGATWEGIEPDDLSSDFLSDVIMAATSLVASKTPVGSPVSGLSSLAKRHSGFRYTHKGAVLEVVAVIDPLSKMAQKMTPLLKFLRDGLGDALTLQVHLNPVVSITDMPLRSYYRYALSPQLEFSDEFELLPGPRATFHNLITRNVLTVNVDEPESWLVESKVAQHDLDNMRLTEMKTSLMDVIFELEALLVTGHCIDITSHEPPRGLQLWLGTDEKPRAVDTIVMSNLGYFQLKAYHPGVWTLRLAPGRSSAIYSILESSENMRYIPRLTGHEALIDTMDVAVLDFGGKLIRMFVRKRAGMEGADVLSEEPLPNVGGGEGGGAPAGLGAGDPQGDAQASGGLWSKFATLFAGKGKEKGSVTLPAIPSSQEQELETINIFSIASGHLYERFLKIMMLSVTRNTKHPVKFWFIKNYLSPAFKSFIPLMAEEYGFEVELVTYKWPTWLHKQTEKQRITWGYKILFLDVIFPLSLKKVIFVDADQIVRADMHELWSMDLQGRPLGYTPFCDNNKDMEGYRFWKQGFWKDHLQGKPYHISALYVVDLQRFRQTAAGDNLRVFYNNLSKDPNSLANLDQDLPNYVQHMVPIFSLPQEWLWCESWCGNATKHLAKTIDLCNNPMTKEPKLEGARRIVAEWPALDEEAARVTERVLERQRRLATEEHESAPAQTLKAQALGGGVAGDAAIPMSSDVDGVHKADASGQGAAAARDGSSRTKASKDSHGKDIPDEL
eukprot:jgi/Mesvir1/16879/Mv15763-RA.1